MFLRIRAAIARWRHDRAEARHIDAVERARLQREGQRLRMMLSGDKTSWGPGQSKRWWS